MRRRSIGEGQEPAQEGELFLAETGDVREALRARENS